MIVVTGTDTGVGKTIVSAAVCAITGASYVKAVQTGDDDDAAEVARLAGVPARCLARFADPLAPASAGPGITAAEIIAGMRGQAPDSGPAGKKGLSPDSSGIGKKGLSPDSSGVGKKGLSPDSSGVGKKGLSPESRPRAVVEGAGGILVRLGADGSTLADVAAALGAPVLVVARAGLGTLNHTALTCEALRARGLECAGVVIGAWPQAPGLAERRNLDDLPRYAGAPLLGRVPENAAALTPEAFRAAAPTWIEGLPA